MILRTGLKPEELIEKPLEEILGEVAGEQSEEAISVRLSDAFRAESESLEDEDLDAIFEESSFHLARGEDAPNAKLLAKAYRRTVKKLADLYKKQKLVAFHLLDMTLDKFCTFFERSNSRGLQLNFTDILAAKLYRGFNLRQEIGDFEAQNSGMRLNRETIVRAVAYLTAVEKGRPPEIDKKAILDGDEFGAGVGVEAPGDAPGVAYGVVLPRLVFEGVFGHGNGAFRFRVLVAAVLQLDGNPPERAEGTMTRPFARRGRAAYDVRGRRTHLRGDTMSGMMIVCVVGIATIPTAFLPVYLAFSRRHRNAPAIVILSLLAAALAALHVFALAGIASAAEANVYMTSEQGARAVTKAIGDPVGLIGFFVWVVALLGSILAGQEGGRPRYQRPRDYEPSDAPPFDDAPAPTVAPPPVTYSCPFCRAPVHVPSPLLGHVVTCAACNRQFTAARP